MPIILSVLSITRLNSDSTFAISLIIFLSDVKVIHVDLTFPSYRYVTHIGYRSKHIPVLPLRTRQLIHISPDILSGGSVIPYIYQYNYLEYCIN